MQTLNLITLTPSGVGRVLNGHAGMLFEVDHFTDSGSFGPRAVCHVRDYRYEDFNRTHNGKPYQIWSLGRGDWEPAR